MPDTVFASFVERQSAIGVPDVDTELAERHKLVEANKTRAALYGPGNMWDAIRKSRWAVARLRIKGDIIAKGDKVPSEATLDMLAYADDTYKAWLEWSEQDKAMYEVERDTIDAITTRIRRADAVVRYAAMEPR